MPSMHLATDQGMNDDLNGLLLDVRLASAASPIVDALKHAEGEISIFELKGQLQSVQPASAIGKTIDRIEGLLGPSGASLVYAGYPYDPYAGSARRLLGEGGDVPARDQAGHALGAHCFEAWAADDVGGAGEREGRRPHE